MSERRAFRVTGRVQGVGFRWWTRETATELGLRGSVRNQPDGSVRVEASGEAAALDALAARLERGPPGAAVEGVGRVEPDGDELPAGFHITR